MSLPVVLTAPPAVARRELPAIAREVAHRYLPALIALPPITWSKRARHRMLACWHSQPFPLGRIEVSRLLDHPEVPDLYLSFLVYHELLHMVLGAKRSGRRQTYHHRLFRLRERQFQGYERAVAFEKQQLPALIGEIAVCR